MPGVEETGPEACRSFGRTEEEICQTGRAGLVDATDPRLREESLARAERVAHLGSYEFEGPQGEVRWSAETFRIVGRDPAQGEPSIEEYMRIVHPDDRLLVGRIVEQSVCEKRDFDFEYRILRADGSIGWVQSVGGPIVDETGSVRRVFGTIMDITERKKAQEDLQRLQLQLAHVARLSTAGEMMATIAHEVNQPLYSILNFAKASGNLLAQDEPPLGELREWNREIVAAATRAGEMIRRMRDFTRRYDRQRTPARLDEIVSESLRLLAFEARRRNVVVLHDVPESLPSAHVHRIEIQQVVVNLVQNALEALEATTADRRIRVSAAARSDDIETIIADNGPGLPYSETIEIFEPFATTKPQGLGMGLAISRSIVEAHGGRLWAESDPQGGARFHFTLPLERGEERHGR